MLKNNFPFQEKINFTPDKLPEYFHPGKNILAENCARVTIFSLKNPTPLGGYTSVFIHAGRGAVQGVETHNATTPASGFKPFLRAMYSCVARVVGGKIALAWGARFSFGKVGCFHLCHLARGKAFNLGSVPKKAAIGQLDRAHSRPIDSIKRYWLILRLNNSHNPACMLEFPASQSCQVRNFAQTNVAAWV